MNLSLFNSSHTLEAIELFTKVFSASENISEGKLIGNLVADLVATSIPDDLVGCVAVSCDRIVGCIFFSRFIVPGNEVAYILSPVAIATSEQGKGLGQRLIGYGLSHIKTLGANLAFTYGDPNYYSKTGFRPISESIVKAPFKLSQPEGWLAQSLDGHPIRTMQGSTSCVEALSDQKYW